LLRGVNAEHRLLGSTVLTVESWDAIFRIFPATWRLALAAERSAWMR
jgi:hypothetical protein